MNGGRFGAYQSRVGSIPAKDKAKTTMHRASATVTPTSGAAKLGSFFKKAHEPCSPEKDRDLNGEPLRVGLLTAVKWESDARRPPADNLLCQPAICAVFGARS
jgi:hypothetical protein